MKTPDPCKHCGAQCLNTPVRGPRLVEQGRIWSAMRRTEYYVKCLECGIMTYTYDTPEEALAAWDRTPREGERMKQTTCVDDIKCPKCGHKFDGAYAVNYDMTLMSTDVSCPLCSAALDIIISVEYTATVREGERDGD